MISLLSWIPYGHSLHRRLCPESFTDALMEYAVSSTWDILQTCFVYLFVFINPAGLSLVGIFFWKIF